MVIQHEYLVRTVVSVEEPCSPKKLDNSFLLNIFCDSSMLCSSRLLLDTFTGEDAGQRFFVGCFFLK